MAKLLIELEVENDAFFDSEGCATPHNEVQRILADLVDRIKRMGYNDFQPFNLSLIDINGAKVGEAKYDN